MHVFHRARRSLDGARRKLGERYTRSIGCIIGFQLGPARLREGASAAPPADVGTSAGAAGALAVTGGATGAGAAPPADPVQPPPAHE